MDENIFRIQWFHLSENTTSSTDSIYIYYSHMMFQIIENVTIKRATYIYWKLLFYNVDCATA